MSFIRATNAASEPSMRFAIIAATLLGGRQQERGQGLPLGQRLAGRHLDDRLVLAGTAIGVLDVGVGHGRSRSPSPSPSG